MKDLLSIVGCRPSNQTRPLRGTSRPAKPEEDGPSQGPHNGALSETDDQNQEESAGRQAEAAGSMALHAHKPGKDSGAVLHALGSTPLHRQNSICPTTQQQSLPLKITSTPDQHLPCGHTSPRHSSPHRQGQTNALQPTPQEEEDEGDVLADLISSLEEKEGGAHGNSAAGRDQFLLHKDSTCSSSDRFNMGCARKEAECDAELAEAMKLVESLMPKSTFEDLPSPYHGHTSPCTFKGSPSAPTTECNLIRTEGHHAASAADDTPTPHSNYSTPPSSNSTPLGSCPHPPSHAHQSAKQEGFLSRSAASYPSLCTPGDHTLTSHAPNCAETPPAEPLYARPIMQTPSDPMPCCPPSIAGAASSNPPGPLLARPLQASTSAPLLAGSTPALSFASLPDNKQQHPAAAATNIAHLSPMTSSPPYGFQSKQEDCLAAVAAVAAATASTPDPGMMWESGMGLSSSLPANFMQQQHTAATPFAASFSGPAQAMQGMMWEGGLGMGQLACSFPPLPYALTPPAPQTYGRRWGAKHLHKDQAVVDAILQRKKPPKPPSHQKRATPPEAPAFSLPGLDAAYWIPGTSHSPFQQGAASVMQQQQHHQGKPPLSMPLGPAQSAPLLGSSPTSAETPSPLKRTMMQQGKEDSSSSAAMGCLQVLPKRPRNTSISNNSCDNAATSDSEDDSSGRTSSKGKGSSRGRGRGGKAGSTGNRPYRRKSESCAQGKGRTKAARRKSSSAVNDLAGTGTRREAARPQGILGGIYDFVAQEQRKAQQGMLGPMMALSQFPQVPPVPQSWLVKRASSAHFPVQPSITSPPSSQPPTFQHSASWHGGQVSHSMEDTALLAGCGAGAAETDLRPGRSLTPLLPDLNNDLQQAVQMDEEAPGDAWAAMFDENF